MSSVEWRGWLFRPEHLEVTLVDGSTHRRLAELEAHSSRVHSRTSLAEITHSGVQIFRGMYSLIAKRAH